MKYIFYLALIITLISCKTQKGITGKEKEIKYESADEKKLFNKIETSANFTNLKIKASANIQVGTSSYPSVSLVLYLDKEKQIWGNASLLLPLARVSVKPEGVKMYEKIGKSYVDTNFNHINNLLNVDFLDYNNIENLLIGKLFFTIKPNDYKFSIQNNQYILTSVKDIKVGKDKNIRDYQSKISFDSNFNLMQVVLEDKINDSYFQVEYDNYITFEDNKFPKNIKIFIKDQKEASISLEYNKFESVKMETPFEIPKGYTQRKIN